MKNKTIKITLLFLLISLVQLDAQSFKDKLFKSASLQFGLIIPPSFALPDHPDSIAQFSGGDLLGFSYNLRYNLVEMNDEMSLGLGVSPAFSLGFGFVKFSEESDLGTLLTLNMPIELRFSIGAGSSYNSVKNSGFALSTGIDLNYAPIFSFDPEAPKLKKLYALPHLGISYCYFGKKSNRLLEFFMRYDFGKNKESTTINKAIINPIVLRFGFSMFLGY